MPTSNLLSRIARKGSDKNRIAGEVAADRSLIPIIFEGLDAAKADIRFGCLKVFRLIGESNPSALYPHTDAFVSLLQHANMFCRLEAARVISNLSRVDSAGRVEAILDTLFAPVRGSVMIPAANIIACAPTIAGAQPHLAGRLAAEILRVETARYATDECVNVARGHAIKALDRFYDQIPGKAAVLAFVRLQLNNTRPATRRKAEAFLKRHRSEAGIPA